MNSFLVLVHKAHTITDTAQPYLMAVAERGFEKISIPQLIINQNFGDPKILEDFDPNFEFMSNLFQLLFTLPT